MLAVLPSIVLGWIIWKNDKVEKEPGGLLVGLFFSGIGSIIVTLLLSPFVYMLPMCNPETGNTLIELFFGVFIGVALVEEFSKWIFVKLITWKNKEFTHIYDAVVYAVFVSLGFATLENILYVVDGGLVTALIRAILAVPLHTFCGVFMGYYYGLAKQSEINNRKELVTKNLFLSLLVPILIHGFYDYCLFTGNPILVVLFYIFVILIYIFAFRRVIKLSKIKVPLKTTYCTKCGQKSTGNFCPNCGNKI
jgi:RsiW-degrading membrane proteinase PrsW (M82 family)